AADFSQETVVYAEAGMSATNPRLAIGPAPGEVSTEDAHGDAMRLYVAFEVAQSGQEANDAEVYTAPATPGAAWSDFFEDDDEENGDEDPFTAIRDITVAVDHYDGSLLLAFSAITTETGQRDIYLAYFLEADLND